MTDDRKRHLPRAALLGAAALAIGGTGLGYWLGSGAMQGRDAAAPAMQRDVLYWYDPMVPDQHFETPGKSPFMDMELVPRYAGEANPTSGVSIDPAILQNLGVRLAVVEAGSLAPSTLAPGVIQFNDRDVAIIQVKQAGFVERGRRRAVGDVVQAGDALVDLRVPEWSAAIGEYLSLRTGSEVSLAAAARQRLSMLGIPSDAVTGAETADTAPSVFTLRSPITGAITSLDVRDGMAVASGAAVARINGLSPVWLIAAVPQGVAGRLAPGGSAEARLPAYPGEIFKGQVEAILPAANSDTRAVEVRIALGNPSGKLRPGMTAEIVLAGEAPRQTLLVPAEAVIRTGRRAVVIKALAAGRFEPVLVVTGDTSPLATPAGNCVPA